MSRSWLRSRQRQWLGRSAVRLLNWCGVVWPKCTMFGRAAIVGRKSRPRDGRQAHSRKASYEEDETSTRRIGSATTGGGWQKADGGWRAGWFKETGGFVQADGPGLQRPLQLGQQGAVAGSTRTARNPCVVPQFCLGRRTTTAATSTRKTPQTVQCSQSWRGCWEAFFVLDIRSVAGGDGT